MVFKGPSGLVVKPEGNKEWIEATVEGEDLKFFLDKELWENVKEKKAITMHLEGYGRFVLEIET